MRAFDGVRRLSFAGPQTASLDRTLTSSGRDGTNPRFLDDGRNCCDEPAPTREQDLDCARLRARRPMRVPTPQEAGGGMIAWLKMTCAMRT